MKKINVDDIVVIPNENTIIEVLVTRVNRTTFQGLDSENNSKTYFIKEISKVYAKQKKFQFEYETVNKQIQNSLF
jgi:hypothetical protein